MPEPYAAALIALVLFSAGLRRGSMLVAAVALAWDWALCVLLASVDGTGLSWFGLFCIDLGTAMLLLMLHTERWQLFVISVFVLMIAMHVTFALGASAHTYLTVLSWLSWAQVFIVAARGGADVAERLGYRDRLGRWLLSRRPAAGSLFTKGGDA